jgi:hypothetical protein
LHRRDGHYCPQAVIFTLFSKAVTWVRSQRQSWRSAPGLTSLVEAAGWRIDGAHKMAHKDAPRGIIAGQLPLGSK